MFDIFITAIPITNSNIKVSGYLTRQPVCKSKQEATETISRAQQFIADGDIVVIFTGADRTSEIFMNKNVINNMIITFSIQEVE